MEKLNSSDNRILLKKIKSSLSSIELKNKIESLKWLLNNLYSKKIKTIQNRAN